MTVKTFLRERRLPVYRFLAGSNPAFGDECRRNRTRHRPHHRTRHLYQWPDSDRGGETLRLLRVRVSRVCSMITAVIEDCGLIVSDGGSIAAKRGAILSEATSSLFG